MIHNIFQKITESADNKKIFINFSDRQYNYSDLRKDICRTITLFNKYDVNQENKILIISSCDLTATMLFLSALCHQTCPVIVSASTKEERLEHLVKELNPSLIFIDDSLSLLVQAHRNKVLIKPRRMSFLTNLFKNKSEPDTYPENLSALKETQPEKQVLSEHDAYIIYSSGSTANPKGILHTNKSLYSHLKTLKDVYDYNNESVIFNNMELSHADGIIHGPVIAAYTGSTLLRAEPFRIQDLNSQLNLIHRHKVTHFLTLPTVLSWIEQYIEENDIFSSSTLKYVISVAGKLENELWQTVNKRFNIKVCNMYGLTETVSGGIFCGPENFKLGSIGVAKGINVAILAEGNIEKVGSGELLISGDSVFKEYYNNKVETANAFIGSWFKTGDLVNINQDGFVKITGRKKSVIISGGRNIHPDEIDEVLLKHEFISESITISDIDPNQQEIIVSIIRPSHKKLLESEVLEHCLKYLEPYKVPKNICFITSELPRGGSGKIKRPDVYKLYKKIKQQKQTNHEKLNNIDLLDVAANVFKLDRSLVSMSDSIDSTALWDSIGHLSLIVAVEKSFQLKFTTNEILSIRSLKAIQNIIDERADLSVTI